MDGDAGPCRAQTALYAHPDASRSLRERSPGPTPPCRDGTAGASR